MNAEILGRYQSILGKLKGASLVAVSKLQPIEKIIELYELGQRDFGENYVQELVEKARIFRDTGLTEARFHFIGHLQTNKVKLLLPWVHTIQSVDSLRLVNEIQLQALAVGKKIDCYFQVNIDEEESKSGFTKAALEELAGIVENSSQIHPSGLMVIPDPNRFTGNAFTQLCELSKQYGNSLGHGLSMGMSDDFELAIRHGSTLVRVGTAIFGARAK